MKSPKIDIKDALNKQGKGQKKYFFNFQGGEINIGYEPPKIGKVFDIIRSEGSYKAKVIKVLDSGQVLVSLKIKF